VEDKPDSRAVPDEYEQGTLLMKPWTLVPAQ